MSRQRQDNKRSASRAASPAPQQRRQTQRAAKTSQELPGQPDASLETREARKKRSSNGTAQLVSVKKPSLAQQSAPTKPAEAPKSAKAAQSAKASRATTSTPTTSPRTASSAKTRAKTPAASVTDMVIEPASAPVVAQMPEIPEVPEMPQTPEIPETPATPDIPEIPEVPDAPQVPEIPEIPETPATPEIPEVPETPEVPEIPETPVPPEQPQQPAQPPEPTEPPEPVVPEEPTEPVEPTEPNTPSQPDNPAGQALDSTAEDAAGAEADMPALVPVATERRMPTLAAMNHTHREPERTAEQPAPLEAPDDIVCAADALPATEAEAAATRADTAWRPARNGHQSNGRQSNGRQKRQDEAALPPRQQTSVITRPVNAYYNNRRRKVARTPGLIWEDDPSLPDLPWPARRHVGSQPRPLPPASLVTPVVVVQIFMMAVLGLFGALLGLGNNGDMATWILVGAIISGAGGAIAYGLEVATLKRIAPYVLVASQLGLLAWVMLLVGPRASLLALIPALVEIALLISGSLLASIYALGALLIYAFFAGLSISVGMNPVSVLGATEAVALDVICVVVGLLGALWLLLAIHAGRERAQAIARARRHEADVLRNLVTQFRQEAQDDTGKLESALLQALKGHGISPIPTEGMYRLLAETIMDTAARLEVLQRDREERLRLEGALRVVVRAVERQWLGVVPEWPGHTGTAIDELVALLRHPRLGATNPATNPEESQAPSMTPRLIPIPTLSVERNTPPPTPISRPLSGASWMAARRRTRRPDLYSLPPASDAPANADQPDEPAERPSIWNAHGYWPTDDEQ